MIATAKVLYMIRGFDLKLQEPVQWLLLSATFPEYWTSVANGQWSWF